MAAPTVRPSEIPPGLEAWFGRLGGVVQVRYGERFYEGRLSKVAATGAFIRLSGVIHDDMTRRTIELPLDDCTLLPKRHTKDIR